MKSIVWINSLFFFPFLCAAQSQKADTSFLSTARANTIVLYQSRIKSVTPLHNGTEYNEYISAHGEHPYFVSDDWMQGSVVYDEDTYEDIPIQFDISGEKVITEHSSSGKKIQLINEKIDEFTIGLHHFIKLQKKLPGHSQPASGFYELLLDDIPVKVVVRHIKTLQKRVSGNDINAEFEEIHRYFYFKDGTYYPVKGKHAALQALSDKKSQLKQLIKKNKITFLGNNQNALVAVARLYNSIHN